MCRTLTCRFTVTLNPCRTCCVLWDLCLYTHARSLWHWTTCQTALLGRTMMRGYRPVILCFQRPSHDITEIASAFNTVEPSSVTRSSFVLHSAAILLVTAYTHSLVHSRLSGPMCVGMQVPVVPITILGSGDVMPAGKEEQLHSGTVHVIVHPPISTRGKKTSKVAEECRDAISSRLPLWKLS